MKFKVLLAVATMTMAPAVASANTVNPTNWGGCIGSTTCTVNGIAISGFAGGSAQELAEQDFRGLRGLGVGPGTPGIGPATEIEALEDESIVMNFTAFGSGGIALRSIQLGHFYNPDEFSDPQEQALIKAEFGDGSVTELMVKSLNNSSGGFTFSDSSLADPTVTRDSTDQGLFTLTNLFEGKSVKTLSFFAVDIAGFTSDNSDYTIASVAAVPLPAAGWMLLAGLGGLFGLRRFRKTA